ncbi:MAG: exonuclease SbcCD subunit D [Clostridiales bacterium]|nr:exonuclease SbcCD subunit D [Clostridiales bacterium]
MKFIHLSDLHLGKRINEYSMIEDQEYILTKIINIIDDENPDGVLIAGDIYDKSIPSAEAVQLFDNFLTRLSERKVQVFIISGNHDSPERMSFASRLIDKSGIHIASAYNGKTKPYTITDKYGDLNVFMLPFVKPSNVRRFFENETVDSYTDAMRIAISQMNIDSNQRNILITHQFVTGASRSESEDVSVGGSDNVDASVFDEFDYVALGHIHSPQNCSSERIRYCGTPLKYSFSEAKDNKSVTVVELCQKGNLTITSIPLSPMHDMIEIKGNYNDIMLKSYYENTSYQEDYIHITLTDEEDIPDAIGKLRTVYHNLMKLDYDNMRTKCNNSASEVIDVENMSPLELFANFYELQNNQPMSEEQSIYIENLISSVWENEE